MLGGGVWGEANGDGGSGSGFGGRQAAGGASLLLSLIYR
jgi:hypothetical protein